MVGVNFTSTQASGVVTTFVTILDIRWQPAKSGNVMLGYYLNEAAFLAGEQPAFCLYFELNISVVDMTQALPPQILAQVIASGGPCPGGTAV